MARKYTREELRERLPAFSVQGGNRRWNRGVTVRKSVKGCELSDPYIYQCYRDLI